MVARFWEAVPKREVAQNRALGFGGGYIGATSERAVWRSGKAAARRPNPSLSDVGVWDVVKGSVGTRCAMVALDWWRCRISGGVGFEGSRAGRRQGDQLVSSHTWHGDRRGTEQPVTSERAIWDGIAQGEQEASRKGWFHGFIPGRVVMQTWAATLQRAVVRRG